MSSGGSRHDWGCESRGPPVQHRNARGFGEQGQRLPDRGGGLRAAVPGNHGMLDRQQRRAIARHHERRPSRQYHLHHRPVQEVARLERLSEDDQILKAARIEQEVARVAFTNFESMGDALTLRHLGERLLGRLSLIRFALDRLLHLARLLEADEGILHGVAQHRRDRQAREPGEMRVERLRHLTLASTRLGACGKGR